MKGYPSNTLWWAQKKLRVAGCALLWTMAGVLRLEKAYGILVRKSRWK